MAIVSFGYSSIKLRACLWPASSLQRNSHIFVGVAILRSRRRHLVRHLSVRQHHPHRQLHHQSRQRHPPCRHQHYRPRRRPRRRSARRRAPTMFGTGTLVGHRVAPAYLGSASIRPVATSRRRVPSFRRSFPAFAGHVTRPSLLPRLLTHPHILRRPTHRLVKASTTSSLEVALPAASSQIVL